MIGVSVVGVGQTKFGELWKYSIKDLVREAGLSAISDAGIDKAAIDSIYIGNMGGGMLVGQEHLAPLCAECIGITGKPAVRCEGACASGAMAFREAALAIKSGIYECVMVLGVEKMHDVTSGVAIDALMSAGDRELEGFSGITFAGLYALMARSHMLKYGTTHEQMAVVSVNNHKNAVKNPYAQFRNEISIDDVLKSPPIAEPLNMLDCSPLTDGAAAIILVSDKIADRFEKPVAVFGSSQASDTLELYKRPSLTELSATKIAAAELWKQTGMTPADVDVLEVHDCFSINEIIALEDLGFCQKGFGGKFVERGAIGLDGDIPTNTAGGLKAIGHPVGASGVRQIIDIVRQIRGDAPNQIDADIGVTMNVGGVGGTVILHMFGRSDIL